MDRLIGLLVAAALSTPAAADLRANGPRQTAISTRSADDLAGCVALRLARSIGYEIRPEPADKPRELKLVSRVAGIAAVVGAVVIEDLGAERRLAAYSTGKLRGAPSVITAQALQCANGGGKGD